MMGFMSNCNRFTSWPLTMQNSGLYTAWNGCCPMDSGFSRTSIKSLFSSSFERRFSPIYIRKNFWYIVLLVCGLIYIGQAVLGDGIRGQCHTLSWSIWASDPLAIQETQPSSSPQSFTAHGKTWGAGARIRPMISFTPTVLSKKLFHQLLYGCKGCQHFPPLVPHCRIRENIVDLFSYR